MNSPEQSENASQQSWLTRGVFGIGLSSLFSDWGHETATALLPILLASLGAPAFALGVIEGVSDGLSSFAKLIGGWIADRPHWRKPVAAGGYLIVALSTFAYGFARSWPTILPLRAFGWMGRGGKGPSRDALLADSVSKDHIGRAFGFERAMDTIGAIAGPLCAIALVSVMSARSALRWTIIPGTLATLSFAVLVPRGRQLSKHPPLRFFESLRKLPLRFRHFLVGVFAFGLGDFAPTLLIFRGAQILSARFGTVKAAGFAIALYTFHNAISAAAAYPAGALGDRLGKRGLLAVGYGLAALMSVGFIFSGLSLPSLGILFGLAGLYSGMREALEKSLATELLPTEVRGSGYGVLATINGVGDFASSIIVGLLWSSVAPAAGFAYAAIFTFAGAVLIYRWR